MDHNSILKIYSYICCQGTDGVTVGSLMDFFKIKKREIVDFLKILDKFCESIDFYYYSPEEDEFIDTVENINKDTIIQIDDSLDNIIIKLDLPDTIKLYEIMQDTNLFKEIDGNVINELGNSKASRFKYINKGVASRYVDEKALEYKNLIVDSILNNNLVDLVYKESELLRTLKNVMPIGVYYSIAKENFNLIYKYNNEIKEIDIAEISRINVLNLTAEVDFEFDITQYIKNKRTEKMVLKIYNEAMVVEKVKSIFYDYDIAIEDKFDYLVCSVNVENPMDFKNIIDAFGMSVIVEAPECLKIRIIEDTKKILENYNTKLKEVDLL